jgi:hypothetical protein
MVSSFIIVTNIQVPDKIAEIFNEKFNPWGYYDIKNIYEDIEKYNISLSSYFDSEILYKGVVGGVSSLDLFLKKGHNWYPLIEHNNWLFKNNILWDSCEKFHGAISVLEFFIKRFFKNNFLLNGTIMAVNSEFQIAYVYNVKDNVISLDETLTRDILKELEIECNKESKHYYKEDYDYYFNREEFINRHFNKYVNSNSYNIKLYNSKIDQDKQEEKVIQDKQEVENVENVENVEIFLKEQEISLRKRELNLLERELNLKEKDLIRREKEMDEKEKISLKRYSTI